MAKYTGPVCKLCRREGMKLFLKGERCYSDKCAIERRSYAPGEHGQRRKKYSEYGAQLREKQKARRYYGVGEKQFLKYFREAERKKGVTADNLLQMLERRLDNIVFRLGLGLSRLQARQMILHGHILVNGRKVNIPSYLVKAGDKISVKDRSKQLPLFKEVKEKSSESTSGWLDVDIEELEGKVVSLPEGEDLDMPFEPHLIVEFYSR